MNILRTLFLSVLLLTIWGTAVSQKRAEKCKGVKKGGDFHFLLDSTTDRDPLYVDLIIPPRKQNDENFVATSMYFKNLYCKQNEIFVEIYDSKEHAQFQGSADVVVVTPESLPRALYYLNRSTGKEGINVVTIVNGKIVNRTIDIPKSTVEKP